ncbi:MAG: glycerol-3-phosphate 1-O-acyltransferase PlsY [Patescibacteria group bacterium]
MTTIILVMFAYLAGSVPVADILAKIKGVDLRKVGSKNMGATNAWRVLGRKVGITCYILDFLKGAVPVIIGWHFFNLTSLEITLVGLAAIIGHIFPLFMGFKGGKGVATSSGVFMILSPLAFIAALLVWLATYKKTYYVSLGSMLAALTLPLAQVFLGDALSVNKWPLTVFELLVLAVVLITHRPNIKRLINGTEPKTYLF